MSDRTVCLWCPDWPVVALRRSGRISGDAPVVTLGAGGRVRVTSVEARARGVRRGMRRREAEAVCPEVLVAESDEVVEARAFEVVARALDTVTHRLALERPGLLTFPARGPARYFGDDDAVVRETLAALDGQGLDARVGLASGHFAALLAARHTSPSSPTHVLSDDDTRAFLAARPVAVLYQRGLDDDLVGILVRLGVRKLGDLAALPVASIAARFGDAGVAAHRLASGLGDRPRPPVAPPPETAETAEFDPPARRVDEVAFVGKGLADRFLDRLADRGLVCSRVTIEAETEHGERRARTWRLAGPVTSSLVTQRVRWQLDAWLVGREDSTDDDPTDDDPTGGLTLVRLTPEEVVPATGRQLGFWGGDEQATDRAVRSLARLQGMLGHDAVVTPVLRGGRTPAERSGWLPWGETPPGELPSSGASGEGAPPWPGAVPDPAPTRAYEPPLPAELLDESGEPVRVSGRGELSAPPARLDSPVARGDVVAWAGPWPQDARWWDRASRRRRALFQLELAGDEGTACLVAVSGRAAFVEALYD